MAIKNHMTNEITYRGCVIRDDVERFWMDGMLSVYAIVWDMDTHEFKNIQHRYIGIDCQDMSYISADVDVTDDVMADIRKTLKARAEENWKEYAAAEVKKPIVGKDATVIRGRKIPKGTRLNVFWMGEKETYMSRLRGYYKEYETICGCYDEAGNKVWIKAEYLEPIEPKVFSRGDRAEWIQEEMSRLFGRGCRV